MRVQWIVIAALINLLVGCVTTEQVTEVPHINLSPGSITLLPSSRNGSVDIGLSVTANESDSLDNLEVLPGVRIKRVAANSVAQRADLRSGDVILAVNGVPTNHPDTLNSLLAAGESVAEFIIEARRDTTVFRVVIKPAVYDHNTSQGADDQLKEQYRVDPVKLRAGFKTVVLTDNNQQQAALQVVKIFPDSPFLSRGINEGDVIFAINGTHTESAQGFIDGLASDYEYGEEITLSVLTETNFVHDAELKSPAKDKIKRVTLKLWQPEKRISRLQLWPLFTYRSTLEPRYMRWSILDFWLVSLFAYERELDEKTVSLFTLFKMSSDYGELSEEN